MDKIHKKIIIIIVLVVLLISSLTLLFTRKDKSEIRDIREKINVEINGKVLSATLTDNSSVKALLEKLKEGPLTIAMQDYGNMEKVGNLGFTLPKNDESITTEAGDIILYQGTSLVIYYEKNNWVLTRIGKLDDITQEELISLLGTQNVTIKLSLQAD